jgi:drug/metabolite transporter (DMT)-like permease
MKISQNYKTNLFVNLLLVYIIWGSTYLGVKIALTDLPPMWLTTVRFLTGGVILWLFSLTKEKLASLEEIRGSSLIGIFLTGLGTSSIAYSVRFIPSGVVALLVAMLPLWIFFLDFFFFSKTKPSSLSLLGISTGTLGIILLFNPFHLVNQETLPFWPFLAVVFGSVSWAWGSLISSRIKQAKGTQGIAIQMVSGGLIALIISLFTESDQLNLTIHMSRNTYVALAYLIFIGSFIGYSAYVWLINNAPPLLTSSYAFVNPVVAILLGYFWINEKLSESMLLASAVILSGVVMMTLGRRKKNYEE